MRASCTGQSDLFTSTNPADHEAAAAICGDCPLAATCTPAAADAFADGTYGGRLYVNGRVRSTKKPGDPSSRKPRPCIMCGSVFTPVRANHQTCSSACRNKAKNTPPAKKHVDPLILVGMARRGVPRHLIARKTGVSIRTVERHLADANKAARKLADTVPEDRVRVLHNAYNRGERTPEVVAGERTYQRNKKREHVRQRRGEAA